MSIRETCRAGLRMKSDREDDNSHDGMAPCRLARGRFHREKCRRNRVDGGSRQRYRKGRRRATGADGLLELCVDMRY